MEHRCIFAGFGGQGIISMGTLLAYAGMTAGKQCTFFPEYGIAMRGGTANCTVIVSDDEIASPVVNSPNVLVVMNELSLDHFQSRLEPGGMLFVNSSLVTKTVTRTDVKPFYVKATGIAIDGGDSRMANMAMLGGLIKATGMLPMDALFKAMEKTFPPKILHLLDKNKKVMEKAFQAA
jgi:2-oxoglutarate ferredoxin oxidoreductase subunit gamma